MRSFSAKISRFWEKKFHQENCQKCKSIALTSQASQGKSIALPCLQILWSNITKYPLNILQGMNKAFSSRKGRFLAKNFPPRNCQKGKSIALPNGQKLAKCASKSFENRVKVWCSTNYLDIQARMKNGCRKHIIINKKWTWHIVNVEKLWLTDYV